MPYKGTAEQMIAVASGQVMVGVNSNGFAPFVDGGRLRLLATFGEQRTKRWPHGAHAEGTGPRHRRHVALRPGRARGHAGRRCVQVLHDAFKTAMFDPAHVAELAKYDQELAYLGPDDYGRAMREAYAEERRIVERLGLARAADSVPLAAGPSAALRAARHGACARLPRHSCARRSAVVTQRRARAARQQQLDRLGMALAGRPHQRGQLFS